jgi:hypothetical protein
VQDKNRLAVYFLSLDASSDSARLIISKATAAQKLDGAVFPQQSFVKIKPTCSRQILKKIKTPRPRDRRESR